MAIKSLDRITITDITDAYSVMMSSEAHVFQGGANGAPADLFCTTQLFAYRGAQQIAIDVDDTGIEFKDANDNDFSSYFDVTISNDQTMSPIVTFTVKKVYTGPCEAIIPVSLDGGKVTISKRFSLAVAIAGTNGTNGTSVTITSTQTSYFISDVGSSAPADSEAWTATLPEVPDGKYLWTRIVVTYSDGNSTKAYNVSKNGVDGTDGIDGENGEDAITLTITTSNGSVFKNNTGNTTLTAHVFVGSVAQEIGTDGKCGSLGSIYWYKNGVRVSNTPSPSCLVQAATVTGTAEFTAQLEG